MLNREIAVARFGVVVFIEIAALIICFLPLVHATDQWQKDCRTVGIIASVIALVFCSIVSSGAGIAPRTTDEIKIKRLSRRLEFCIITTYILNVLFLFLVIARTGGPTNSLYGTLIPIQLSAILFLQLQKDRIVRKASLGIAAFYFAVGIIGYVAALLLHPYISAWSFLFAPDPSPVNYAHVNAPWAATLTVLGMGLSFLTYAIPADERFILRIQKWYGSSEVAAKGAAR